MTTDALAKPPAVQVLPLTLVGCGIALIALSFVWPSQAASREHWSTEDAKAFQAASVKLHSLSHEATHTNGKEPDKATVDELHKAEAEFHVLRDELNSAIDRPKNIRTGLRIAGAFFMIAGGALIYYGSNIG